MNCLNCNHQIDETYRVNQLGELFCSEDCYDHYPHSVDDSTHPYIDTYESIRSTYLDWLLNWENDLQNTYPNKDPLNAADEMNDKMDEIYEAYSDFYRTEGHDGVFAREIYLYMLKFEDLQKQILNWRPKRQTYYYLSLNFYSDTTKGQIENWFEFAKYLYEIKAINLFFLLKDNLHPHDTMAFYFENQSHLNAVLEELENVFGKDFVDDDIFYDEAYLCEGGCNDYEAIGNEVDLDALDGWFFCSTCEEAFYPGYFSIEELINELDLSTVQDDIQLKYSKTYNWHYYIRKVKRSCRYHDVEFPEWIDFEYE